MTKSRFKFQLFQGLIARQTCVFCNWISIPTLVTAWMMTLGTQGVAGGDNALREAILFKRDSYQILHPTDLLVSANEALAEHESALAQIEEINTLYLPEGVPGVRIADQSVLIPQEIFVYFGTREELFQTRSWGAVNGIPGFFDFIELGYPTFPHSEIKWPNRGQDRVAEWLETSISEPFFLFVCSSFFISEVATPTNVNIRYAFFFIEEDDDVSECYERLVLDYFGLRKLALGPFIDQSIASDLIDKIHQTPDRTIFER